MYFKGGKGSKTNDISTKESSDTWGGHFLAANMAIY